MTEHEAVEIMAKHGIKPTANRITIVRTLHREGNPMSLSDLEDRMVTIDKSSISRTLTLFRESHLVHSIDNGIATLYELCLAVVGEDTDTHVHFYCERCHRTYCMENTPIPHVCLPDGFSMVSASFIIKGICPDCAI